LIQFDFQQKFDFDLLFDNRNITTIPFPQCKTLLSNNSASITHRAVKFAWIMGFWAMADQMV